MIKLNLHPLPLPHLTEQEWHDLLAVQTAAALESRPHDPAPSPQAIRQFLEQIPTFPDQVTVWLLYDEQATCVGLCILQHPKPESPDYKANKDRVYVEPVVLAPYRRQGIGTQLLPFVAAHAQKAEATWVQWDTKFESGFRFSSKIEATEAGRQQTNRLRVDQVDWAILQQWADEGQSRHPAITLNHFVNLPPAHLIAPFCDLITAVNRLQPSDAVEGMHFTLTPAELRKQVERQQAQEMARHIIYAQEPEGTLIGMTDMYYKKARPNHALVALTGVRKAWQGRGLGKWLKAAMLLDMRQRFPEIEMVDTENFNTNASMLHINHRLGFQLFEQYRFYKIKVEELAAYESAELDT